MTESITTVDDHKVVKPTLINRKDSTRITVNTIQQLCKAQKLYQTPYLNEKLYLNQHGFTKIENLELYTGLKALYLEGNGIHCIENLENQTQLRALFVSY
jgi:dynein assembly factor 1